VNRTTLALTESILEQMVRAGSGALRLGHAAGEDYTAIGQRLTEDTQELHVEFGPAPAQGLTINSDGDGDGVSLSGEVPHPDGRWLPIDAVRIVGERIEIQMPGPAPTVRTAFDRQIRAFGAAGQEVLGRLHIGVVGAGGTGSAVCEQLIRLGVGHITVIDHDLITETNVTRVWVSTSADVGVAKVQIVARSAEEIGFGTEVTAIVGKITDQDPARALRHCDVIFGCTDDNLGRTVLARLAYMYLIPVFDMGVKIDAAEGAVVGIDGRLTYMAPGLPCLVCRGWIDLDQATAEGLPEAERTALAAEGYVAGLGEPDPSVIAYTTAVAAHAVSDLLARLFRFGDSPPPNQLLQFHNHSTRTPGGAATPGHFCCDPDLIGCGDLPRFLNRGWVS
jgi:hypothetical protein